MSRPDRPAHPAGAPGLGTSQPHATGRRSSFLGLVDREWRAQS
jgi:hypothetical protein